MRFDRVKKAFRRPGSEWRGAPFWAWNDDLDPAELRRQVREMKRAGLGGFFMHNRIGLVTPYMGERWMECIAAAVGEARKQGMHAWLYDEDRWPSGYGGGAVPKRNPDFGMKVLAIAEEGSGGRRFAVRLDGAGEVISYRRLKQGERRRSGETLRRFDVVYAGPTGWFNDGPYSDNMNPEAVQAFIETCYGHTGSGSRLSSARRFPASSRTSPTSSLKGPSTGRAYRGRAACRRSSAVAAATTSWRGFPSCSRRTMRTSKPDTTSGGRRPSSSPRPIAASLAPGARRMGWS